MPVPLMYDQPSRYSALASPWRACCRREDISTCGSLVSRIGPVFCEGSAPVAKTQNQSTASDVTRKNAREFITISFELQGPEDPVCKNVKPFACFGFKAQLSPRLTCSAMQRDTPVPHAWVTGPNW